MFIAQVFIAKDEALSGMSESASDVQYVQTAGDKWTPIATAEMLKNHSHMFCLDHLCAPSSPVEAVCHHGYGLRTHSSLQMKRNKFRPS